MDRSSAYAAPRAADFSEVWRPSASLRMLVQCVLLSVIGLPLLLYHGISLHLTPWSQAIVNAIVGHVYGPSGQRDTTVVLFREENLEMLEDPYPVPYARHADVLEALAVYGPRAVFVDFAFIDPRRADDVNLLSRAICSLSDNGRVPVFLAAPPPPSHRPARGRSGRAGGEAAPSEAKGAGAINKALLACAQPVDAQMDTERGVSGVLTYAACPSPECDGSGGMLTPAFGMYRASPPPGAVQLRGAHPEPMEIIWANGFSKLNWSWMDCRTPGPIRDLMLMLREDPLAAKRKCPYTNTISVIHLLGPANDGVKAAIADKAVFYGASFQMAGDRVISPVYEDLPGVYLHAMAYDNLVTFGADYKRAEHHPASRIANVILLVFTVFLLLVVDKPLAPATRLLGRIGGLGRWMRWAAIGLAVVSLALTMLIRPAAPALFLLPALVFGMLAFLHVVATRREEGAGVEHSTAPAQFIGKGLLGLALVLLVALLFLVVDSLVGIGSALLFVLLPGYFVYKAVVARDWLFVVTTVLLIGAAVVCFLPPINLGPRNIVGYVAFFELARHLIKHADKVAGKYLELRREHPRPEAWGMWVWLVPIADRIFTFFVRGDDKEMTDEGMAHATAS